tara:strand:+ start:16989 stop:20354 length:3366 start_codon:yes stop_codon:yes gene_type:complete
MMYDGEGLLVVEPGNGDICEDDITYQMLYLLYEDILTHPLWQALTSQFIHQEMKDSEFVPFASNTLGISDQIFTIIKSMSYIGYWFISIILLYKAAKIGMKISKDGTVSISGDQDGDPVKMITYTAFLITLSLPVGGIMLGQGLSIAGAIPSLYGSNYLLSGYLSTTQLGESDVEISDEALLLSSQVFANNVVGMQLCQNRTAKALFAVNAKSGTEFFYDTAFANFTGLNTDEDDVNEKVDQCMSYHYESDELGLANAVERIDLLKKPKLGFNCSGDRYKLYSEEIYGYQHNCGVVQYNYPTNIEDINNWGIEDELEALQADFSTLRMFGAFKSPNEESVRQIINYRELEPAERQKELETLFRGFADTNIIPALNASPILDEPHRERLATKYIFALNAMLGGVNINELSLLGMVGDAFGAQFLDINPILPKQDVDDDPPHYGFTYIADYARYAADEIEQYHCAKNWEDYTELRQFIVQYNFENDSDTSSLLTNKVQKMECVRFVAEHLSVDSDFSRYLDFTANWSDSEIFADLEVDQANNMVKVKQLTNEELIENKEKLFKLVAEVKYQQALVRKTVIEGYYYAVKYAVATSLSQKLREESSNDDMYMVARQMGAGNLGGILMALSQKQSGGVYYKKLIENAAVAGFEADDEYFVNFDGFGDDSVGAAKVEKIKDTFEELNKETFFSVGLSNKADVYQASSVNEEEEAFSTFMNGVEKLLFEPVIHIQKASGMPDNITLKQGLDNCLAGQNEQCLSTSVHPIVALSRFGHHLMDNMLTLAAVGTVTIMVNDSLDEATGGGVEEGGDSNKKKGKFNTMVNTVKKIAGTFGKGLFAVVFIILAIAAAIFKILMPFIWGLFIVGAFFSYILPLMGYIYSMSMYILWIVGLSLGGLVLPFYIALKLFTIEDSYKRGFVEFYETFLNPYVKTLFITIAVIFSWTFAAISLFAVNSVFALLYDGLSTLEAGVLTTIIFKLLLYMVYFVTIFVMFLTSIKIIKNMPDMMATKMKLKGTNDDQFIESMSFENYVQAGIMRQVASLPQSALSGMSEHQERKKQDKVLRENLEMMQEFLDSGGNGSSAGSQGASENSRSNASGASDGGKGVKTNTNANSSTNDGGSDGTSE